MPDLSEQIEPSQAAENLHFHIEHLRRMMRERSLLGNEIGRAWLVKKVVG